ncbi:MAG TPA: class I SAM-dependent methyltransferase [Roseiflexaceae bacterium]|nr:class I SAM-dependent methyltransferase [Roseiflexaceae bacterium]
MPNQALCSEVIDPELSSSHVHSAMMDVLQAVFGQRWVGQQRFTTTAELDALHEALGVGPEARVLDIGSGLGGPAIHLAQHYGCHVTGIDISDERVQLARRAAREASLTHRVKFVTGDVLSAAFPADTFDAIVSHNVWLTIANKAHLFERCHEMLRPGGRLAGTLIVQTGRLAAPPRRSTEIAWPIPTANDYRDYAERAGLRVRVLDDVTRSFREVCARWRGALVVWDLVLLQELPPDAFALSPATIAQVAEWSAQGMIGQVRMVTEREGGTR